MPLAIAPVEKTMRIVKVAIDDEKLLQRLRELGILPSSTLEVLTRDQKGGTVIVVKGTRLALDRDISRRIFVC